MGAYINHVDSILEGGYPSDHFFRVDFTLSASLRGDQNSQKNLSTWFIVGTRNQFLVELESLDWNICRGTFSK